MGRSFSTFNQDFARELVDHRTVIIVMSDGWDCGDVDLLAQEMQNIKRRCRKVLWLNPLLASPNYEPLCKGMQAVLPHLDYFLPAHNLESLVALGRTLEGVSRLRVRAEINSHSAAGRSPTGRNPQRAQRTETGS